MRVNTSILSNRTIALGFSGGRDSIALALWLKEHNIPFRAVHVNHQLQKYSDGWAQWCVDWCKERHIEIDVHRVELRKGNVENAARDARRTVWQNYPVVALCHHQNDQHETFFLRMLRGSGARGLSAMQESTLVGNTLILRPMLNTTRNEITNYVTLNGSGWIEDPTNADTTNDRNYIRREMLPRIYERFERAPSALNACIKQMQDAAELLDCLAEIDAHKVRLGQPEIYIDDIWSLGGTRTRNMLHYWLGQKGIQVNGKLLNTFVDNLFATDYNGRTEAKFGEITIRQRGRCLMFR